MNRSEVCSVMKANLPSSRCGPTLLSAAEEILMEVRMGYLLPSEYVTYGLTADTQDSWVTSASAMMEAYCKRPTLMSASYTEYLRVSRHTQRVRLSYGPLISVDAVQARYARPSRLFLEEQPFAAEFAE